MFTGLLYPAMNDLSRIENGMIVGAAAHDPQQKDAPFNDLIYRLKELREKRMHLESELEEVDGFIDEIKEELERNGFWV